VFRTVLSDSACDPSAFILGFHRQNQRVNVARL
jgi:hypothetical protein